MKKLAVLALMLIMLFSASLTVSAEISPSGTTSSEAPAEVPDNTSPQTGENDSMLFVLGAGTVVLGAGALAARKKANA